MKRYLLLCLLLSGCAQFDNRLACTLGGGDRLYVVSEYMRLGVTMRISEKDAERACEDFRKAARVKS